MSQKIKAYFWLFNLILCMTITCGCIPLIIGAAAGAGGAIWVKGNMEKNVDYPVDKVHQAALAALKELDLVVRDDEVERHSSSINAEFDDGEKIKVDITALTEKTSKINVRVGFFGEQNKSMMILNAILKKL